METAGRPGVVGGRGAWGLLPHLKGSSWHLPRRGEAGTGVAAGVPSGGSRSPGSGVRVLVSSVSIPQSISYRSFAAASCIFWLQGGKGLHCFLYYLFYFWLCLVFAAFVWAFLRLW